MSNLAGWSAWGRASGGRRGRAAVEQNTKCSDYPACIIILENGLLISLYSSFTLMKRPTFQSVRGRSTPLPSRQSRSPDSRPVIGGATRGGIHVARAFYTRGSSHYASFFRLDCPFWTGNSLPRPAVPLLSAHCAPSLCLASRVDYWSSGVSVSGLDSSSLAVCLLVSLFRILSPLSVGRWMDS